MSTVNRINPITVFGAKSTMTPLKGEVSCSLPFLHPDDTCVKEYTDLLKQKEVVLIFNSERILFALVNILDPQGSIVRTLLRLPVTGVPKEIIARASADQLIAYLDSTHLSPEKGVDDEYNRVAVTGSLPGGGYKSQIPFQPGLALGSILRAETLVKLEAYAEAVSRANDLEDQINNAEKKLDELQTRINSRKGNRNFEKMIAFWEKQKGSLQKLIENLQERLGKLNAIEIPIFEGFQQALESPIDRANSKMEVQPRGFDSLHFTSQYISMKESLTEIHDKVEQASRASSASVGGGWLFCSGHISRTWSEATAERLLSIKKEDKAEGVLMVNAMVSTRHIRCFTDLKFDRHKLKMVLEAMKKGTEEDYKRYGITVREDGRKEIYVLTETLIGGSFTAFVTFLDENKFKEERKKHAHEDSSTTSANARGWFFTRIDGDYSQSSQEASQTEDDIARAVTKTRVNIEIVSQGVVPKFTREVIEHEILKHLDLNPSKFEISQRDESDVKTLITGTHQERAEAALRQQIKMANAQVAVVNTYRGLISTKDKQHIHTPHSAMEAYDNFAAQMTTDQGCGVPIGFNYQVLDEARLKQILDELDPSAQGGTSKGTLKEEI